MPDLDIKGVLDSLHAGINTFNSRFDQLQKQVDAIDARSQVRGLLSHSGGAATGGLQAFCKQLNEGRDILAKSGRLILETPTLLEEKQALITSSGLFSAQPATEIAGGGRWPYRLRRLFRVVPAETGSVFVLRSTNEALAVSPQSSEGATKAESSFTFSGSTVEIPTIASFVHVTRQALDDVPGLEVFLRSTLLWGLEREAEGQILSGAGTGANLSGLTTTATAFDISILVASDGYERVDILGAGACQLQEAGFNPDFACVSPRDWFRMCIQKSTTGEYVLASPRTTMGKRVFDLDIVVSDQMADGYFVVGDSSQAVIRSRMTAQLDISFEHGTNFTENKATIRCEERFTLQKQRTDGFVYGALDTSPA